MTVTLTNDTDAEQFAVLIGAKLKANSDLKDRVLTDHDFKAETGLATIGVSEIPEGQKLEEIQEFLRSFGGRVIGAKLTAETSLAQSLAKFIERTYSPIQVLGKPFTTFIPAQVTVGTASNAGKMVHMFNQAFVADRNKSLVLPIAPNTSVCVELLIEFNSIPGMMATA